MTSSPGMTSSPSRGNNKKRVDSVNSLTIKQLNDSEDSNDSFVLESREISKVWVYGRVLAVDIKPVNVTYTIDDGTGRIDCTVWIQAATETVNAQEQRENIKEDMYVKVIGQLRTFSNKRQLSVFSINPVKDSNEIVHHFLSVITTHIQVTKGPLNPQLTGAPQVANNDNAMEGVQYNNSNPNGMPVDNGDNFGDGDFTRLQRLVLNAFQEEMPTDHGRNIGQVMQILAAENISELEVKKTIMELQDDGHLYSTVDDAHYKTTCEQ